MRRAFIVLWFLTLAFASVPGRSAAESFDRSNADAGQVLLRTSAPEVIRLAEQYGLTVVAELDQGATGLFLLTGPPGSGEDMSALLSGDPAVTAVEPARVAALPEISDGLPAMSSSVAGISGDLAKTESAPTAFLSEHLLDSAWAGYTDQEAVSLIRLHLAHAAGLGVQPATIAFIDTGVDPEHPLLSDALVPGYDFLLDRPEIASEWSGLDQSLTIIIEDYLQVVLSQSEAAILSGTAQTVPLSLSTALILDQSLTIIIETYPPPPGFGHGTMVAGLLRLTAPHARLMPLKAFNEQGYAHVFDVVSAIYFAVEEGADVINMSFSTTTPSPELQRAVDHARSQGVICIAAAGNGGQETLAYPAALANVLGVAATNAVDQLSLFSNYGVEVGALAAPGEGIVSTYPGGLYAAGWGTSFSTALVSGAAALIWGVNDTRQALMNGSVNSPWLQDLLESGRLDVFNAVMEAHATNGAQP